MKTSHLAVLALAVTGFSSEALAWGADGHRAVAAIALKLLPPDKAQAADNLLNNSDVGRGFVDAASYADEVIRERDHRHVFSPWHFVDWPADAATYSDSFCDPDCIVNELPKQIEAMRTSTDMEAKALAMSWVIHLMGDLHQPMHVTDRGDRGGNELKVTYNGRTRCRESNSSGAETKRKWAGRQDRLTRSKMTHSGHRLDRNPAVQQSPAASDWVQHRGVGSARLDSEQFRSAPRTARPLGGRLIVREFSISTEGDSTMNAQTVQDRRGLAARI